MPTPSRIAERVLLVGWDGADWGVIEPLVRAGQMPHLAGLLARGARGKLAAPPPLLSPVLWTSVATGKRPHKHGVLGHHEPWRDGRGVRAASAASRSCKAVWDLLGGQGMACNVIGWPVTHPVGPLNGAMVSNHYALSAAGVAAAPDGQLLYPPDLAAALRDLAVKPADIDPHALLELVPRAAEINPATDDRLATCAAILAEAATLHSAATHLIERPACWALTAVCYPGIERFCRAFMSYHPPRRPEVPDEDFDLYREVVARGYAFHDMMLGRLLELAGRETTVILVSGHGYAHGRLRPVREVADRTPEARAAAWHRPHGIAVAAGPGVRVGVELIGPSVPDVTPTVLALLGVPGGADMDGRAWLEAFDPPIEPDRVLSWEHAGPARTGPGSDWSCDAERRSRESIAHLRTLGYAEPPDLDVEREVGAVQRTHALNLARALVEARLPGRAIETLLAPDVRRGDGPVHDEDAQRLLAEAYFRAGRFADARATIEGLLARGTDAPLAHLGLAGVELAGGDATAALAHVRRAEEQNPALPGLRTLVGWAYLRLDDWDAAARAARHAVELDPDDDEAHDVLAAAQLGMGQDAEAAESALRAISLRRDRPGPHHRLGVALARLGRPADAARAFEAAVTLDPDRAVAHDELAGLYEGPLYDPRRARQHRRRIAEIALNRTGPRWEF